MVTQSTPKILDHTIKVLLIDDQAIVGEAVKRMLIDEKDIEYHFCQDPTEAIAMAERLEPTVILQDLIMPEIDGLTLVKFLRANAKTRHIPLIVLSTKEEPKVKAEAFAFGANDYLVKLPDRIELIARIRYHSNAHINFLERLAAYKALQESQNKLAAELAEAAEYVRSLLPDKLDGEITTDCKFIPSIQLGGDAFGYHWLDDDHFAIYLLDVSGHGVGAALLSVSVMNALRAMTLPNTDFRRPSDVLRSLNLSFPVAKQNFMFFTIWYGVYGKSERVLTYASGGHPSAILIHPSDDCNENYEELPSTGLLIGVNPNAEFTSKPHAIFPGDKLYVFSDGVFEIQKPNKKYWTFEEFVKVLREPSTDGVSDIERIFQSIQAVQEQETFVDDYSMLQVVF